MTNKLKTKWQQDTISPLEWKWKYFKLMDTYHLEIQKRQGIKIWFQGNSKEEAI